LSEDKGIDLRKISLSELLKVLIDNHHYKKNKLIKNFIINFIELFFLKEYMINKSKKNIFYFYQTFIYKIHNVEKFNLDEESLFLEFKFKLLNE
jgi:DNA polymerase-3 subunit delta'